MTQGADPVRVTGLGCICACGANVSACMESMYGGRRSPRPPSRMQTDHETKFPVFEIPWDYLPAACRERPEYELYRLFLLHAVAEALSDAELSRETLARRTVGVCIGTTVGGALNDEDFFLAFREGRFPGVTRVRAFLGSDPGAIVAREYGLRGPVQTVTNACTSGTVAVGQAAGWIRHGVCDIVITGGVEKLTRLSYDGFACLHIADAEACRPFDRDRGGLNLGEGSGILILESGESAQSRRGKTRGHVLGYGNTCDAYHLSAPRPDGAGLRRAIDDALRVADRTPADIAFINAHGTGTTENDRVEERVFSERFPATPYGSTKGYTGHMLGAAGGIEAVVTLACLARGRIPGNAGFREPDPAFDSNPVRETTPVGGDCALSLSVAYGGNNAALLMGKAES